MRLYEKEAPYEKLKELTQGRRVTAEVMREYIEQLDIPEEDKKRLRGLEPKTYYGNSVKMATKATLDSFISQINK